MILKDLCPAGRKKYAEFEKFAEAFRVHGRVQSMSMMYIEHQKFLDHMASCEVCLPMEELGDD